MDYNSDSDSSIEMQIPRKRRRYVDLFDSSEDNQPDNIEAEDFLWKKQNSTPTLHDFTAVSGVTTNVEGMSRCDVFELFFNKELVQIIIRETNKFGSQDRNFVQVTEDDLKLYIAINILMSLVQKPNIQSYWSKDESIETPYFKNVMPRKRFLSIAKNLHFASDNNNSNDPLIKIKEVSDVIAKTFRNMYIPKKNICIDESLMQCKNRLHYIQFIRTKRAKFGIKFYKLCDSETRYIHNFKIYIGKDKTETGTASANVVKNLMNESELLEKGYCLFLDNWYSSPTLYRDLYEMKTNVCGTARINRKGMPRDLKSVQLKKGEAVSFATKNILAIKWKDKKDVIILTTMHKLEFAETEKVNRHTGEKIVKPSAIIDYNKYMGGIDVGDQMLSKFHTMRRSKKAYKKIFFYFIDMMLLNSYVIFKQNKKDRAFHVYKQKLAEEIIQRCKKNESDVQLSNSSSVLKYTGRHFPVRIPQTKAKGRRTSRRCIVCAAKAIRRETVFQCDICNVPLCIDDFKIYHTA